MPRCRARRTSPRLPGRHSLLTAVLAVGACALGLSLPSTDLAFADAHPPTSISASSVTTTLAVRASRRSTPTGVHTLVRVARTVAQDAHEQRVQDRQDARQLRRERREQARLRAERAAARALNRWVMPVSEPGWSAPFGQAGSIWSSGYHTGQDFTAPYGTPVLAAGAGTITFAGWNDAYGNKIEITHVDGNETWYAHLSEFAQTSGTVVGGDVIGYVGCTGNCFGNHLHFEFHPGGGAAVDPVGWLHSHHAL